jgi:hypothetical protein
MSPQPDQHTGSTYREKNNNFFLPGKDPRLHWNDCKGGITLQV